MSILEILHDARQSGVRLSLKDGKLALTAKGPVPPALLERIKTERDAIKDWLAQLAEDANAQVDPILKGPPSDIEPLSFAQSRLWIVDRLEGTGAMYNMPTTIKLTGELDQTALQTALDRIVQRHEILRTIYVTQGDGLSEQGVVQKILPAYSVPLPFSDLTQAPDAQDRLEALQFNEVTEPFDLETGPILRARLVRLATRDHRLLLTLHHIASDGWSSGILIGELMACYQGQNLAEPPIQYADFARWQRRMIETRGKSLSDWWAQNLKGVPEIHDLPTDQARTPTRASDGAHLADTVPLATAERLRAIARAHGVTLFSLLFAAYAAFLHRQSGQQDIVIGTPIAGRERDELKQLVGLLVNTLPLRSRLSDDMPFTRFLENSAKTVRDAIAHQDLPFEAIVERVNPRRSLSHAPIVQLAFTLTQPDTPNLDTTPDGLLFEPQETPLDTVKFELSLGMSDSGGVLPLDWNYATDLFSERTIASYNFSFLALLDAIAANPETNVGDLPLVSPAETQALLALGTGPRQDDGPTPPAPDQLFEMQAARTPDAPAVLWQGKTLGYGDLNNRANRLAHHLKSLGFGIGDRIAIATGRNFQLVEAMLAVCKIGACYVLVPVDAPTDRIAIILEDSGAALMLTVSSRDDLMGLPQALAINQTEHWQNQPTTNLVPVDYVEFCAAYTSGTTGRPKGVLNTRRGITSVMRWLRESMNMQAHDIQTAFCNPGFDGIQSEVWPMLAVGGTVAMLEQSEILDVALLQAALDRINPTHIHLTTGLLHAMCDAGLQFPASIKVVYTAGEQLQSYCLPEQSGLPLINFYGPTEASCVTLSALITPDTVQPLPIGRPAPNTNVYILDPALNLVPRGAIGELCLSGPYLGPGYINLPEETARKFVPNPYAIEGHETLYLTGDLARWRGDDTIECLGRTDNQVKIRGFRIEPQEIASVISAHAGVRSVFVDVIKQGSQKLVAYVVPETGHSTVELETALRRALAGTVPAYMMPDYFQWLDQMPLTDRGKTDRRALGQLAPQPTHQVNTASPRDDIELKLYDIWSGILLHPQIGLRDNFFDIGGNSLSAIKVVHQTNTAFGTALPVTDIIAHPSIEEFGGLIRSGRQKGAPQNPITFRTANGIGSDARNVICIHPGGGTAFAYLSLAKVLPAEYGVYGVQSVGVQPGEDFLPDIGAMADHYITLVEHLLDVPCVITGASFGGVVAFEMVRRLKLRGHDMATAILLDALGSDDPAVTENETLPDAAEFRQKLITYNGMYPGIEDAQIDQYQKLYNHNLLSSRRWKFERTQGRIILVQSILGRTRPQLRYLRLFWQMRCKGPFLFKALAGDHSTILQDPDVQRVGHIITEVLEGRLLPRGDI